MIKSIVIKNVQSHKDTLLEFTPGVNVIIGSSGAGKSAIMRAVGWVMENRPTKGYPSDWLGKESSQVTINFDDCAVTRLKDDRDNYYQIDDTEPFRSLGSDVPPEVANVINMDETNFKRQMESHFLLSETAGRVAQHYNKMSDLYRLDGGIRVAKKRIQQYERDIKSENANIKQAEQELESFEPLEEAENQLLELEHLEDKYQQTQQDIKWLQTTKDRINRLKNVIAKKREQAKAKDLIQKIVDYEAQENTIHTEIKEMRKLRNKIVSLRSQISVLRETAKAKGLIEEILRNNTTEKELRREFEEMIDFYNEISKMQTALEHKRNQVNRYIEQYNKHAKGQICPLCDGEGKILKINK